MRIEPYPTKIPAIGYTQKQLKPPNQAGKIVAQFEYQNKVLSIQHEHARAQQKAQVIQSGLGVITDLVKQADDVIYSKQYNEARISAIKQLDNFLLDLQKDPDYESYDEKYMQKSAEIMKSIGEATKNRRARKDFMTWYENYSEQRRVDIAVTSRKLVVENAVTTMENGLNDILENVSDPERAKIEVTELLRYNEQIGVIHDFEALGYEQKYYHAIDYKEFSSVAFGIYEDALVKTNDPDFAKNTALEYIMSDKVPENITPGDRETMHKSIRSYSEERRLELARKAQELDDKVTNQAMRDVMEGRLTNHIQFSAQLTGQGRYVGMSPEHTHVIYNMLKALQKSPDETTIINYKNPSLEAEFYAMLYSKRYTKGDMKEWLRQHQITSEADIKNLEDVFGIEEYQKLWNDVDKAKENPVFELVTKEIINQVSRGELDAIEAAKVYNELIKTVQDESLSPEEQERRINNALEAEKVKKTHIKILQKALEFFGGKTTDENISEAQNNGVWAADPQGRTNIMIERQKQKYHEDFGDIPIRIIYDLPDGRPVYGVVIDKTPMYLFWDIDTDTGKGQWYTVNDGFKMDTPSRISKQYTVSPVKMGKKGQTMEVFVNGKYKKVNLTVQEKVKRHLFNIGQ